jgi:hypothetical protein
MKLLNPWKIMISTIVCVWWNSFTSKLILFSIICHRISNLKISVYYIILVSFQKNFASSRKLRALAIFRVSIGHICKRPSHASYTCHLIIIRNMPFLTGKQGFIRRNFVTHDTLVSTRPLVGLRSTRTPQPLSIVVNAPAGCNNRSLSWPRSHLQFS